MAKREEIEARAEELLLPVVSEYGLELVDVDYVKEGSDFYLRAYIDKPGGVTIGDCETVSRAFDPILDREDFVPGAYIFEVSSPGLGRPLKKDKDYARAVGQKVEGKLFMAADGIKAFEGTLTEYTADTLTVDIEGTPRTFRRADMALIRLAFDF
ncbi:MAG: ribosome maturation factor RimP [Lachnospiraceae bacterium]|nr:ribosome maturation factor RimP [Lachnospiraceae bacterium]